MRASRQNSPLKDVLLLTNLISAPVLRMRALKSGVNESRRRSRARRIYENLTMTFETVRLLSTMVPNEVIQPILLVIFQVKVMPLLRTMMTDATDLLAALKAEKAALHELLRSYEREFYREHNRQASSSSDIQPVINHCRRCKEIRHAIRRLELEEEFRLVIYSE
jgi:hypothetical protein